MVTIQNPGVPTYKKMMKGKNFTMTQKTMKGFKACILLLAVLASMQTMAQHNLEGDLSLNTDGTTANSTTILDVQSTTKGVVFSRMTSAQRNTISSPTKGLLVYDTDLELYCYHDSLSWRCFRTDTTTTPPVAPDTCETLDGEYDCGGPGAGRTIQVDAGSVFLRGTMAGPSTTLEVENEGTGSVATFRDEPPGGGTENLIILGQDGGDAMEVQVLGAANTNRAIYAYTNSNAGQAGLFEITHLGSTVDALEGYNRGDRHGVFGHTDVKVPVSGAFSIAGLPVAGVMGVSSGSLLRKGSAGSSLASDGVWGKTWVSASGFKTVADPRNIIAGVHGTIESAQSTIEEKDFVGVFGIPKGNGVGVLGVGGPQNGVKGHGVVGISAWSTNTPSTNAAVWGVTREAKTWAAMNTTFPLEEDAHNKVQVGVLGQSENFVALWGESLNKIGVVGTSNTRLSHAQLGLTDRGVYGYNGGAGYGVEGRALSTAFTDAGIRGVGQYDKDKAAALEIHDGAIRVSKDSATHTPADFIDVAVTGWATLFTCPGGADMHDHEQAYMSAPITIVNQYCDAMRSVILVSVMSTIPGVSIQLLGQADGEFDVAITVHSANLWCTNNPPSTGYKIHYMIVNK